MFNPQQPRFDRPCVLPNGHSNYSLIRHSLRLQRLLCDCENRPGIDDLISICMLFRRFFFFLFIPNRDTLDSLQQLFKIISRANNECYREIVVFILSPAPPFSSTSCVQLNDVGLVNGAL